MCVYIYIFFLSYFTIIIIIRLKRAREGVRRLPRCAKSNSALVETKRKKTRKSFSGLQSPTVINCACALRTRGGGIIDANEQRGITVVQMMCTQSRDRRIRYRTQKRVQRVLAGGRADENQSVSVEHPPAAERRRSERRIFAIYAAVGSFTRFSNCPAQNRDDRLVPFNSLARTPRSTDCRTL